MCFKLKILWSGNGASEQNVILLFSAFKIVHKFELWDFKRGGHIIQHLFHLMETGTTAFLECVLYCIVLYWYYWICIHNTAPALFESFSRDNCVLHSVHSLILSPGQIEEMTFHRKWIHVVDQKDRTYVQWPSHVRLQHGRVVIVVSLLYQQAAVWPRFKPLPPVHAVKVLHVPHSMTPRKPLPS